MQKCILLILLVLGSVFAQPTISNIQFLPDLLGTSDADIRSPLLSPDGQSIFYESEDSLCLYQIDNDTKECFPFPETLERLGRYSPPVWSPDSRRVVFTDDDFFLTLNDSDIWQLDVTNGDISNLTDDGDARFRLTDDNPNPNLLIDYLHTFSPQGELYFFRSRLTEGINEVLGEKFSLELFKFNETGEPVRVSSLRPQLPVMSIYQPAPISPDGKTIALIVTPPDLQDNPNTGIWLQDLATGKREKMLGLQDIPETRPEETEGLSLLTPRRLHWVNHQNLILYVEDYGGSFSVMTRNAFYLDLETKTVTPFEDFSKMSQSDLFKDTDAENPMSKLPLAGFVTPDAKHYLYAGGFNTDYFLWARSLPLNDEPAQLLGSLSKDAEFVLTPGALDTPATVSKDGKRALILGYLLTLE
jgi:hypothetical protein